MKSSAGLHFKTYAFILLMVIFGPLGNILLGQGMKHADLTGAWSPTRLFHAFSVVFRSGVIWLGVGSLMTFFAANMLVLSWADFSYVQPASAVAYLTVALLGHFALHEAVAPAQWAGVLIICLGVLIVGRTPLRTTEHG